MALGYPHEHCPWQVWHGGHRAFRLRALLAGDFAPGKVVRGHFVITREGVPPAPASAPVECETCGAVPRTDDLEVEEVATRWRGVLDAFRKKTRQWPRGHRGDRCWWCQGQGARNADGLCAGCAAVADPPTKMPQGPADVRRPEEVER